jgi:hypothetical protein
MGHQQQQRHRLTGIYPGRQGNTLLLLPLLLLPLLLLLPRVAGAAVAWCFRYLLLLLLLLAVLLLILLVCLVVQLLLVHQPRH